MNATHSSRPLRTRFVVRWGGFDAFVSYSHTDGLPYAMALENRLVDRGWTVFRDAKEIPGGHDIRAVIAWALRRAHMLVVIDTPGARGSDWVAEEIRTFVVVGRPLVRVVPEGQGGPPPWPDAVGRRWVGEDARHFAAAMPSDAVLTVLDDARRYTLRNQVVGRISSVFGTIVVAALVVAVVSGSSARVAHERARLEEASRRTTEIEAALQDGRVHDALLAAADVLDLTESDRARAVIATLSPPILECRLDPGPGRAATVGLHDDVVWVAVDGGTVLRCSLEDCQCETPASQTSASPAGRADVYDHVYPSLDGSRAIVTRLNDTALLVEAGGVTDFPERVDAVRWTSPAAALLANDDGLWCWSDEGRCSMERVPWPAEIRTDSACRVGDVGASGSIVECRSGIYFVAIDTPARARVLPVPENPLGSSMLFGVDSSEDGRILAGASEGRAYVWRLGTHAVVHGALMTFERYPDLGTVRPFLMSSVRYAPARQLGAYGQVQAVAWGGAGGAWFAVGQANGDVIVWQAEAELLRAKLTATATVWSVDADIDHLAVGYSNGEVAVWSVPAWADVRKIPRSHPGASAMLASRLSPAGEPEVFEATDDGAVYIHDVKTNDATMLFPPRGVAVADLGFADDVVPWVLWADGLIRTEHHEVQGPVPESTATSGDSLWLRDEAGDLRSIALPDLDIAPPWPFGWTLSDAAPMDAGALAVLSDGGNEWAACSPGRAPSSFGISSVRRPSLEESTGLNLEDVERSAFAADWIDVRDGEVLVGRGDGLTQRWSAQPPHSFLGWTKRLPVGGVAVSERLRLTRAVRGIGIVSTTSGEVEATLPIGFAWDSVVPVVGTTWVAIAARGGEPLLLWDIRALLLPRADVAKLGRALAEHGNERGGAAGK